MKPAPTATLAQLVNQFREKFEGPNVARTCVLIGAGCSYNSKIPLGGGIVTLLQRETFRKLHVTDGTTWPLEDAGKHEQEFNAYLDAKNLRGAFDEFCKDEEKALRDQFDALSDEVKKSKLPPDWQKAEDWKTFFEEKLLNFYADARYEYWFQRYSENASDRQRFVERVIDDKDTGYGYATLASLVAEGYVRNVFTTNFDDLLHDALMHFFSERPKVYAHSDLSDFLNLRDKKPNIVKLHGDFRYQDIRNTTFEIDETRNRLTEKLRDALTETPCFNLVVMGYGGADVSILNELHEAKRRNPLSAFQLIWTDRKPYKELHWRVTHLLESTPNNFFLHIESFDLLMLQLHQALQLTPVEIVKKAKERQKDIDAYYRQMKTEVEESNLEPDEKDASLAYLEAVELFNQALEAQELEEKCRLYEQAVRKNPDYYQALNNWGLALDELGRYEDAIGKFQEALRIIQYGHFETLNWGNVLSKLGRYEEAISKYQEALRIKPDYQEALNNWGATLSELGRYEEAIGKFQEALRIKPDYQEALNNWGIALSKLKRYDEAILKTKESLFLNNDDSTALFNLACFYALKNDLVTSVDYLEQWMKTVPTPSLDDVHTDTDFDAIRDTPKFQAFLKRWEGK